MFLKHYVSEIEKVIGVFVHLAVLAKLCCNSICSCQDVSLAVLGWPRSQGRSNWASLQCTFCTGLIVLVLY